MKMITDWFRQQAGNPQVVFLTLFLLVLFVIVVLMGNMLAPLLAAVVIAYLLEGLVVLLQRSRVPRVFAVLLVYCCFCVFCDAYSVWVIAAAVDTGHPVCAADPEHAERRPGSVA